MEMSSKFKMYWKEYGKDYLLLLLFLSVFSLVAFLYDVEQEALIYASILCILIFAIVKTIEAIRFLTKHKNLQTEVQNLPQLTDNFPKADTLSEQDLQEIVFRLEEILSTSLTECQSKEQNAMDFYTTWVHQIKTPIAVIKMILQGEDTKEHRLLSSELFRIEQYVDMVLSYLRLDSDSSDYLFKEYDLDRIIKEAIHKYAPQFIEKKIALSYEPTGIKVLTDEKWLSFIIEQILSNAIKYTPSGSVSITVSPDKVLKISDTGIGIASEDLPRIFQKGFTGYNGRSDKKATGLGLYLCKQAAQKLSHTITAESDVGKGTTISLSLKRAELFVE